MSFDTYNEELQSILSKLRSSLSTDTDTPSLADLKIIHELLQQGDDILKQMGLEARGVDDADIKRELLGKVIYIYLYDYMCASLLTDHAPTKHKCQVRIYKTDISKLREEYNTIKDCIERSSLGLDNDSNNNEDSHLLNNNIKIRNQNETLANAIAVAAETEQVAMGITQELDSQRETVNNTQQQTDEVISITERAQGLIQSMQRRKESLFKFR